MDRPWEEIADVRRKGYAVTDKDWIRDLLIRARHGVLATVEGEQPFAYPRLFVYDASTDTTGYGVIYIHGAKTGRTWTNLAANPRVCFNVCEMGALLPAKKASDFNVNFSSVVVFGEMRPLEEDIQAGRALQLLMDKYFPDCVSGKDYEPITPEDIQRTAVYRLEIHAWSGKAHEK